MEKNDAQISGFSVVKKAPSPWRKCFSKKKSVQLICTDTIFKTVCGIFFEIMGLEIFNFWWFYSSEKLFFSIKLLTKLDWHENKKIPHTILETIIISSYSFTSAIYLFSALSLQLWRKIMIFRWRKCSLKCSRKFRTPFWRQLSSHRSSRKISVRYD